MDGYLLRYKVRGALTAAALLVLAVPLPAAAGESVPAWLSAVGDFVRDGLAPPRTVEDLQREEREQAYRQSQPKPPDAKAPEPQPVRMAAPAAAPEPIPAFPPAPIATPMVAAPAVAAPPPEAVPPAPAVTPAPAPAPAPAPRPVVAPAEIKPRPVVPVARVLPTPPPPEPLTGSRIAATATLDQAIKLGGPAGLYGRRVKKPQAAP